MKNYIGPEAIIEKKKKYIMPCLAHFYKKPREFVRGSMQYLYDSEGRKYLDCFAGVSVINCGHYQECYAWNADTLSNVNIYNNIAHMWSVSVN